MIDEEKQKAVEKESRNEDCEDAEDDDVVDLINKDDCCICQDLVDVLTRGHLSSCDHHFHFECIVAWAKVTNLCPLCKTRFNSVTRQDAHGVLKQREVIEDVKQIYRPDSSDHDLAAQMQLVNEARCEYCGSGEDEHVLLMCEVPGCGVANHTYCIGLRSVPNSAWYCVRHSTVQHRASDQIVRPATTVSTRRRTRRLANLMSNVLRRRGPPVRTRSQRRGTHEFVAVGEEEDQRPVRGIAAAYVMRMSRELLQVQRRADAMFARGDLAQSSLYGWRDGSTPNDGLQPSLGTRSNAVLSTLSTINQTCEDKRRNRKKVAAAAIATRDSSMHQQSDCGRCNQSSTKISSSFAPEYCELARLMQDAVSSDDYALSVALLIPKTAKLRLVSRVKTFFSRLNQKEKVAALELGCLSVLHDWIRVPTQGDNTQYSPNPQVLNTAVGILESLPVRQEDLVEEDSLQSTMDCLSELSHIGIEIRQRIIELGEKWRDLNPSVLNESPRPQLVNQAPSPIHVTHTLPVIEAFTPSKRPTLAQGKRKRKREVWSDTVVDYVKAKLYPLYKQSCESGVLTRDRFKVIVKEVASLFSQEAALMQSAVLLPSGELSNFAKSRIKKLIDQVYKTSTNDAAPRLSAPLLMRAAPTSTYSAVPSVNHHRKK
ncbi:hypothetical protein L914_07517 [Plasmopara halstedii]|uniref:RING-type domain-containing protein n=1 Tax=Plasmopara halstedii TaxID=4781 RepID=A0A0P1ANY3_PLAHL|nr:hypothetical protein L914_07517 [Plasmopara halstedii]CEG43236.1 hypothetical protein L914_07517 [Plasmopara halstedii]|eukprot:XP_024579605.1 hypothetical protein L914_07517 [Plasmopara halstedii]